MPYLDQLRRSFHQFACAKVPLRNGSVYEFLLRLFIEGIPRFFAFLLACCDTKDNDMETVTVRQVLSSETQRLTPRQKGYQKWDM